MRTPSAGKASIVEDHRHHATDTGSSEVQVAIMTQRIRELTTHLQLHKKDNHTRRGLLKLVGRRSKLLRYVRSHDATRYQALIEKLGIRGVRTAV